MARVGGMSWSRIFITAGIALAVVALVANVPAISNAIQFRKAA